MTMKRTSCIWRSRRERLTKLIEGSDGQSIIELDSNGNVMGIELWNAKERKILETLESIVKERWQ
ncbi:MAG: hypothetical protein HYY67_04620 [Thaumarchaeota archaeon]|nr:hypothetical protein [Nitrososphaerota archaeon]